MTENNYSIFDDVTMPEYLKDKNLPEHYYYLLKYVGKTGQTLRTNRGSYQCRRRREKADP